MIVKYRRKPPLLPLPSPTRLVLVQGVALLRRALGGGDLESPLLDKLESLSRLRRLGGDLDLDLETDLETGPDLRVGIGLLDSRRRGGDLDREGEGERGLPTLAPGAGEMDLIRVSTGVRDLARWSARRGGGGERESE